MSRRGNRLRDAKRSCGRLPESPYKRRSVTNTPFDLKGRDWLRASDEIKAMLIDAAYQYWRSRGFPYYRAREMDVETEFRQVLRSDWRRAFDGKTVRGSNVGLRLANAFHPGMWSVKVSRYLSPMDVFRDDMLLRSAIRRALKIWPGRFAANASCLRRILKTFPNTASVSNFKPTIAKAIIAKYSRAGDVVVDFAAGYGGRLMGCLALPRHYIGIEPSPSQVKGLRRLVAAVGKLKLSPCAVEIHQGCAEEVLGSVDARSANLVFSSPPYFDWERYSSHRTQSFRRYRKYEEWIAGFLEPVIFESRRILRRNGYLALNISNGHRSPTLKEVTVIAENQGFSLRRCYRMIVPKVPYLHPRNGASEKAELIVLFGKR